MFEGSLLEILVPLASTGASGIAILGIFLCGWLLYKLPPNSDDQRHRSLRHYMNVTLAIAVVSAVSGTANAYFNAGKIEQANEQAQEASEVAAEYKSVAERYYGDLRTYQQLVKQLPPGTIDTHGSTELQKFATTEIRRPPDLKIRREIDVGG